MTPACMRRLTQLFVQLFVSIICVAIALPVTLFLENLFEKANEVEGARESCARSPPLDCRDTLCD